MLSTAKAGVRTELPRMIRMTRKEESDPHRSPFESFVYFVVCLIESISSLKAVLQQRAAEACTPASPRTTVWRRELPPQERQLRFWDVNGGAARKWRTRRRQDDTSADGSPLV